MKKAIIWGANGQDGYYLNNLLTEDGIEVIGISRSGDWLFINICDYEAVCSIVKIHKPDYIFHLAANSTTHHSALFENHDTISTGTFNLLEAVKNHSPATRVFLSGSGLQFKNTGAPIKETDSFNATSAYSVSRIQSVFAARYYRSLGLQVYFGYFFNHESPIRPERHMSNKIASFVRKIAQGYNGTLDIGDISVRKEWTYAGDIVKGIYTLVKQDHIYEATIGSGLAYSIKDWLNECFVLIGKDWGDYIIQKPNFVSEYKILYSDPSTIFSLGWKPEETFSSLARMMILEK